MKSLITDVIKGVGWIVGMLVGFIIASVMDFIGLAIGFLILLVLIKWVFF